MPGPAATYVTRTGRTLTDDDITHLAAEAESTTYRPTGRPRMGSGPAKVVPVRLDPELHQAVIDRAGADATSVSEVTRAALRAYLATPAG